MWVLVESSVGDGAGVRRMLDRLGFEVTERGREGHSAGVVLVEADHDLRRARTRVSTVRAEARFAGIPVVLGLPSQRMHEVAVDDPFDDFVGYPYDPHELSLRLLRAARRTVGLAGAIRLDVEAREAAVSGERVRLTRLEFGLLAALLASRGRVLSREQLLDRAWGGAHTSARTVDVHVRQLRKKLGAAGAVVETVRGVGYKVSARGGASGR